MGRVKKSIVVLLFSLVLVMSYSSFSFAAADVLDTATCTTSGGASLLFMNAQTNAHAASTSASDASAYPYSVCYSSLTSIGGKALATSQILHINTTDPAQCYFSNKVVGLSSLSNAHVESAAKNTYDFSACYDHLDCRVSSVPDNAADEQVLAKLSGDTNAHISTTSDTSAVMNKYLICREPICDATPSRPSVFPLISGFESASDIASTNAIGGATFGLSAAHVYTGASSLKITYPISSASSDESVLFLTENKYDWSKYDYLEFYLYVENSLGLSLTLNTMSPTGVASTLEIPISGNYAPLGIVNGRWNLIQIPISEITSPTNVFTYSFDVKPSKYQNFIVGKTYTYYVDSIQLASASTTSAASKYYCSLDVVGTTPIYSWQSRLSKTVDNAWLSSVAPLSQKTSSGRVCGEQSGEYFADGIDGCFNSVYVTNGTPIDFLNLKLLGLSDQLCTGSVCRLFIPPLVSSSPITLDSFAPYQQKNFILKSVNTTLQSGAYTTVTSGSIVGTAIEFENMATYTLVNPRIVYGSKMTFDSSGVASAISDPAFYSCGDVPAKYSPTNLLKPLSAPTTVGNACPVVGQYACSPSGSFVKQASAGKPLSAFVSASYDSNEANGCCGTNDCWGDNTCHPDQSHSPNSASFGVTATDAGYRCYAGKWARGVPKQNYDGSEVGFCSVDTQCLVTTKPTVDKPACISDKQFYQNYYCDGGNWSTRTAILASQLIDYAKRNNLNKGTLYCDHYGVALNVIDGSLNVPTIFDGIINGNSNTRACANLTPTRAADIYNDAACVNSFCVFSPAGQKPIFGTSLNRPFKNISGLDKVFTDCSAATQPGTFAKCGDPFYSYEPGLQLVVYDPNVLSVWDQIMNVWESYIVNPILDLFTSNAATLTDQFALVNQSKLFSRYYSTTNNPAFKETAFYEVRYADGVTGGKPYYVFSLSVDTTVGKTVNLCDSVVDPYNKKQALVGTNKVSCVVQQNNPQTGWNTTVIVGDSHASGLWSTLTANLRPS